MHACYVKHWDELGTNGIVRDAQRRTCARNHLPRLISSVTFSGLSCLQYLPDVMEREGSEEEQQSHNVKNKKYY